MEENEGRVDVCLCMLEAGCSATTANALSTSWRILSFISGGVLRKESVELLYLLGAKDDRDDAAVQERFLSFLGPAMML